MIPVLWSDLYLSTRNSQSGPPEFTPPPHSCWMREKKRKMVEKSAFECEEMRMQALLHNIHN